MMTATGTVCTIHIKTLPSVRETNICILSLVDKHEAGDSCSIHHLLRVGEPEGVLWSEVNILIETNFNPDPGHWLRCKIMLGSRHSVRSS